MTIARHIQKAKGVHKYSSVSFFFYLKGETRRCWCDDENWLYWKHFNSISSSCLFRYSCVRFYRAKQKICFSNFFLLLLFNLYLSFYEKRWKHPFRVNLSFQTKKKQKKIFCKTKRLSASGTNNFSWTLADQAWTKWFVCVEFLLNASRRENLFVSIQYCTFVHADCIWKC